MQSTSWRLLITPPLPGAANMALDRALAELYPTQQQPTLRFYRWSPACLSLGLGQRLTRDVDRAECARRGIEIVRRPTGGRAILHDQEVTYALVADPATTLPAGGTLSGPIVQSYRTISAALCAGLARLGLQPEFAPRSGASTAPSAACFDLPGDYEITIAGRKLVGSAQARRQGVLLQHGTILLHADPAALAAVLRLPPDLQPAELAQRLVALDEVLGYLPRFEEVVAALVAGFETTWQIRLEPGEPTAAEQRRAAELAEELFANPAWTGRR